MSRIFSRELLDAVRGLDAVSGQDEAERARNPLSLSYLLEVVGWPALEAACEILLDRWRSDGTLPTEGGGS